MKICLKAGEHLQIEHDGKVGFAVYLGAGVIHVRAKGAEEPEPAKTTVVLEANVEIAK